MSTRNKLSHSATRFCFSTGLLAAAISGAAHAATTQSIDLVCASGCSGTSTNTGTIYSQTIEQPTGTGVFDPFLRIQDAPTEQGYNADYKNAPEAPFDEKVGTWTHSLQFGDLSLVDIGGTKYYEFLLDLDEPNNTGKWGISLENVQLFNSGGSKLAAPFSTDLSTLGTKLYDMDSGDHDVTVFLDGSLTSGNGQMDMSMFIPESYLSSADGSDYLTFYSKFGHVYIDPCEDVRGKDDKAACYETNPIPTSWETDGSFEEWAVRDNPSEVPVPGTLGLLGMGVAALGMIRRKASAPLQVLA
jgi:hypothetical protein